ncbi:GNAT family N-acetyltransferase [Methylomonas sp. MgM2]
MQDVFGIAEASEGDIPALCDLLGVLFGQEAEFEPNAQNQRRGLAEIIANPAVGRIFVARSGDNAAGMINLLFSISTALGGRVAWLEDMVVAPAYRGKGVGSALLTHAVGYCRAQGVKRITLLTDASNIEAQRFYKKQGFARSEMLPMRYLFED